jgi:hypothetical protein
MEKFSDKQGIFLICLTIYSQIHNMITLTEQQIKSVIERNVRCLFESEASEEVNDEILRNALRHSNMAAIAQQVFKDITQDAARSWLSKMSRGIEPFGEYKSAIINAVKREMSQMEV